MCNIYIYKQTKSCHTHNEAYINEYLHAPPAYVHSWIIIAAHRLVQMRYSYQFCSPCMRVGSFMYTVLSIKSRAYNSIIHSLHIPVHTLGIHLDSQRYSPFLLVKSSFLLITTPFLLGEIYYISR